MGKLDYNKKVWFIFAPSPNLKVPRYIPREGDFRLSIMVTEIVIVGIEEVFLMKPTSHEENHTNLPVLMNPRREK